MTALAELKTSPPPGADSPTDTRPGWRQYVLPVVLSAVNAVIFMLIRPGVEDLWAARAREYAADHGVGLTYWFGWFGGGTTPGNYSVITPYLSALISAELLGALSAVAITAVAIPLLRGSRHPVAGVFIAGIAAGSNLWSGRIPFLLGSAFTVGAFLAVRHQRRVLAGFAGVLSVFASPVTGAFLALGLAGTFLSRKSYRGVSATTIATVGISLILVAILFGNPGPEHFTLILCLEMTSGMLLCLFARPPDYVRTVLYLSIVLAAILQLVPNGMGSNFARLAWFYVPVAVVALSGRKVWVTLLLVAPIVFGGVDGAVNDVTTATQPMSNQAYYTQLSAQLDKTPALSNLRLEVVTGSHAADTALLDHAMLARGWETQEDDTFNSVLQSKTLNSYSYKVWLDNNAVGYVALPLAEKDIYPEYTLVKGGSLLVGDGSEGYLQEVWSNVDWRLYRVVGANPVVAAPATLTQHSPSRLTIKVPQAGKVYVRVRYSRFLRASLDVPPATEPKTSTTSPASKLSPATVMVSDDGFGWTVLTTTRPGTYYLHGTISGLFG
jgi:hypothetical protein